MQAGARRAGLIAIHTDLIATAMETKKNTPSHRTTKENDHGLPGGGDQVSSEPREERLITSPGPTIEEQRKQHGGGAPETGPGGE